MFRLLFPVIVFLSTLATIFGAAAQKVELAMELRNTKVGTMDTFEMKINFSGSTLDGQFVAPKLSSFDIIAGPYQMQSTTTRKTKDSVIVTVTKEFTYRLQARKAGDFWMGPAKMVDKDGVVYRSDSILLNVVEGKLFKHQLDFLVYNEYRDGIPGWETYNHMEFETRLQKFFVGNNFVLSAGSVYHRFSTGGAADSMKIVETLKEIDSFLLRIPGVDRAGTLVYNHEIRNYYAIEDPAGLEEAIDKIYAKHKSGIKMATFIEPASEWYAFFESNKLSQYRQAWSESDEIAQILLEKKDDLKAVRNVYFRFYSKNMEDLKRFADYTVKNGYKVDSIKTIEPRKDGNNNMLLISKRSAANAEAMYPLNIFLRKEFNDGYNRYHGTYEGMEVPLAVIDKLKH